MTPIRKHLAGIALLCGFAAAISPAHADENLFGYVYSADPLPKGATEAYVIYTDRARKAYGQYRAQDYKVEIEHALTDKFTIGAFMSAKRFLINDSAPYEDGEPAWANRKDRAPRFSEFAPILRYNFMSPYKDAFGLSLQVEPIYNQIYRIGGDATKQYAIENKLIFQKNLLDDQLVLAANLGAEWEYRKFAKGGSEHEWEWEVTAGASYRIAPKWYLGAEYRRHSDFLLNPESKKYERNHWFYQLGPTVHYGDKNWWATFTWLKQIKGRPGEPPCACNLTLDEGEKREWRLKIGYNFK